MLKVAIAISALFFVAVSATPYRDCGSTATLTEVRVPGCSVLPCIVYRGTNVTVQYDFTATAPSTNLTLDVTGKIGGVVLPWPGDFPAGCDSLIKGDCPLTTGESITASTVLVLSPNFPAVDALARWALVDENLKTVVCFEVSVKLL